MAKAFYLILKAWRDRCWLLRGFLGKVYVNLNGLQTLFKSSLTLGKAFYLNLRHAHAKTFFLLPLWQRKRFILYYPPTGNLDHSHVARRVIA